MVIEYSCTFWVWYNLLTSLTPEPAQQALPVPGGTSAVRIRVAAGEFLGYIGGRPPDFSVVNSEFTLSGFIVPERYAATPWKIHVVVPYDEARLMEKPTSQVMGFTNAAIVCDRSRRPGPGVGGCPRKGARRSYERSCRVGLELDFRAPEIEC